MANHHSSHIPTMEEIVPRYLTALKFLLGPCNWQIYLENLLEILRSDKPQEYPNAMVQLVVSKDRVATFVHNEFMVFTSDPAFKNHINFVSMSNEDWRKTVDLFRG